MNCYKNRWIKLALWGGLYLLWVIWLGNYWWLLGLAIIFDLYITKKVKWAFWRRSPGGRRNALLEWVDAVIFAVVAAMFIKIFFFEAFVIPSSSMEKTLLTGDYLFVSKLSYGPKVPETPLSFPLVHNTLPLIGGESYSTLIQNKYRRLKGLGKVKREDIVVFHFPNGDTVLRQAPMADYYQTVRLYNGDREQVIRDLGPIVVRPRDKKDNYVKRCVAVAGDTLQIKSGVVYINGVREALRQSVQSSYTILTTGAPVNQMILDDMGINASDAIFDFNRSGYFDISLTHKEAQELSKLPVVKSITENIDVYPPDYPDSPLMLFPFTSGSGYTRDNFGPIWIPKKGVTVPLDLAVLPYYERIITSYEGNSLEVKEGSIFINGSLATSYTFAQDYFWMMGDNRHNSLDSRYWGFVPEDHIIGKPAMVWFSSNKEKGFPSNIRWRRIFKFV